MRLVTETIIFHEDRNVTLDMYVLQQASDSTLPRHSRPAIVICPGGGYNHISEGESLPAMLPFLNDGYQTFVLSYSINDDSSYPNPLVDVSMAVRWVRAHANRLQVDSNRIAIMGFSAGGNCAAMLATQWHLEHWKPSERIQMESSGFAGLNEFSNRPNAAILCYATTDLFAFPNLEATRSRESGIGAISVERVPESNPVDHVSADTCPIFLWHTAEDETVPATQSIDFARQLLESGVPVELHMYERGMHGLSVANRLTHGAEPESVPTAVATWLPLAISWLNQRFGR